MRKWMVGAFGAAMMMGTSLAWAEPTAHDRAEAKRLFDEATTLLAREDASKDAVEKARLDLLQAYKLAPSPEVTYSLALIQVKAHHWAEAVPLLRKAIAEPTNAKKVKGYPKPKKDIAAEFLARVLPYIGRIHVSAPAGSTIYVNDDEATIEDGAVLATIGTVSVRVDGATQQVTVTTDSVAEVDFTKHEPPPPVAQKTPGSSPATSEPTPVVAAKAHDQAPASSPPKKDNPYVTPTFVVGGGAVVAVVGYVLSAVEAHSKGQAVLQQHASLPATGCPNASGCQVLQSDVSAHKSWSYAQDAFGVASLALVAGTGVFAGLAWHSSSETEPSRDAALVPVVAPGFAGLSFSGSF